MLPGNAFAFVLMQSVHSLAAHKLLELPSSQFTFLYPQPCPLNKEEYLFRSEKGSQVWSTPLIPRAGRQGQVDDLCVFKGSLVYIASSRIARAV